MKRGSRLLCTCGLHRQALLYGVPHSQAMLGSMAGPLPMPRRDWLALAGSTAALLSSAPSRVAAKLYGTPVTYDYVASGVVTGTQTTRTLPDGSLDVDYEFSDRGRGPKFHSIIRVDRLGLIAWLRTTGTRKKARRPHRAARSRS